MKATTNDLRTHSQELIEAVNRGEDVVIVFRGKPCARLVPFEEKETERGVNKAFGMRKDHEDTKNVEEYVRNLRQGRFQ